MATALYAGSFDPVHLGHVDIVEQAARCFERVVVGAMTNPSKRSGMFTASDRLRLLREATNHLVNVTATSFNGLAVGLARTVGADVLVRAAHKEGRTEYQMAAINFEVAAIPTVFLPASAATVAVSSSIIRTLTLNGRVDAVRHLVPPVLGTLSPRSPPESRRHPPSRLRVRSIEASLCQGLGSGASKHAVAVGRSVWWSGPGLTDPKCRCQGASRPRWIQSRP